MGAALFLAWRDAIILGGSLPWGYACFGGRMRWVSAHYPPPAPSCGGLGWVRAVPCYNAPRSFGTVCVWVVSAVVLLIVAHNIAVLSLSVSCFSLMCGDHVIGGASLVLPYVMPFLSMAVDCAIYVRDAVGNVMLPGALSLDTLGSSHDRWMSA